MNATATAAPRSDVDASLLTPSVEGIMLNFVIRDRSLIAAWLWKPNPTRQGEAPARLPSTEIVKQTFDVSLMKFLEDLPAAGFALHDLTAQVSPFPEKYPNSGMVRFIFHRVNDTRFTLSHEGVRRVEDYGMPALESLATKSFWNVQGWRNRLGAEDERYGWGFKCESRTPLYDPQGQPLLRRRKDGNGIKTGIPLPYEPIAHLRIVENRVVLQ